ncbi:MAG: hypothetical protein J6L83_03385, partial [Clostridia bacterium]|nr:hypothetical protein [Clostridia bacterium]
VNVHKGSIEYAENEGQGSVFTVTLPLDSSVLLEPKVMSYANKKPPKPLTRIKKYDIIYYL